MLKYQFSLLLLFCVGALPLYGQEKFERESRIHTEDAPLAAQEFVNSIPNIQKVKWYLEEHLTGYSIEAKLKLDNNKYSVEFDTLGQLEDIELLIQEDDIPAKTFITIKENLGQFFSHYRIKKTQIQYTGNTEPLLALVCQRKPTESYTTKFELVVKGRTEQGVNLYEMLFDKGGHLLNQSKIVLKNANNLEY